MKAKTKQQGYYKIKSVGKTVHFSMNAWINLKAERGLDVGTDLSNFDALSPVEQLAMTADLIYAGILAYDQENGIDVDYTIYDVRNWINDLTEEDTAGILEVMTISLQTLGKKKAKK